MNTEHDLLEAQAIEETQKTDGIELSLTDLDLAGGGAVADIFA